MFARVENRSRTEKKKKRRRSLSWSRTKTIPESQSRIDFTTARQPWFEC